MSDTKTGEDGEANAGRSKTLSLKRTVESGQVRQSFSHGRSKSVLVEKRRKRTINSGGAEAVPAEEIAQQPEAQSSPQDNLSKTQQDRRQAAVIEAKQRAIEEAKQIRDRYIAEALQLPPIKLHCSVLAEDSIKKAIENWEEKSEHRKHNKYNSSSDEVGQN